ncbi:MAG TPA: hypothetical protein VFB18_01790 [Methyloceanibacter sp.]|nr:hypothetical protein [Methyloceanibacter sp.]
MTGEAGDKSPDRAELRGAQPVLSEAKSKREKEHGGKPAGSFLAFREIP